MMIEFFLPMESPPTMTHQEKKVTVVNGKPKFYEPSELKTLRVRFIALVAQYAPSTPLEGAVRLTTKWIWPGREAYKTTKPDTDNMIKLLKDCMTRAKFWKDDAQVASEITEKFFGKTTGIYIKVESL